MKKLFFIFILCVTSIIVSANGDPVTELSALLRSANPSVRPLPDIQVVSETLTVTPGTFITVQVRYVLWNKSNLHYIGY